MGETVLRVGGQLRDWRERRRLSQLELAGLAGVSARHLSFVETGRSRPTSATILRLAAHLEVPLRQQNRMLLASGYSPAHPKQDLAAPSVAVVHDAVERLLMAHRFYPALVIDPVWDLVSANDAVYRDGRRAPRSAPRRGERLPRRGRRPPMTVPLPSSSYPCGCASGTRSWPCSAPPRSSVRRAR